ncbi:unnamed protein product [Trichogramma brassicae]|uniref:Uncharacterized protein n=1 Tax=Trichogramma brassicae TaxID=86971 RepID=A0A6H5IBH5_9HYME|nr:unnamed protein product [Trichogramma brassicae]
MALTHHCAQFIARRSVTACLLEAVMKTVTDSRRRVRENTNKQMQRMEQRIQELQEDIQAKFAAQTRDVTETISTITPEIKELKACAGTSYAGVAGGGGWRVATGKRSVTLPMPRPATSSEHSYAEIFVVPDDEKDAELKEPLEVKRRLQESIKP